MSLERPRRGGWLRELPARIALGAVLIAVSVGAAVTAVTTLHEARGAEVNLRVTGQELSANLAHNAVVGVLAGDRVQVERAARALLDVPDVMAVVVRRHGAVFVTVERSPGLATGATLSFVAPIALEPSGGLEELYDTPAQPRVLGTAEVVLSHQRSRAARRTIILVNGLMLAGATMMAIVAALWFAHRITRPIERLSVAAERVGAGRLDVSLPVESADVIGRLSHSFNKMVADLRKVEQAKSNFMALVSHELRTPIVAIKGYLQLANSGGLGKMPEELIRPLQAMERNVNRLAQNVEVLLLFSGIELGELNLVRAPVQLCECIATAVGDIRQRAAENRLAIEVSGCEQPLLVLGDRVRLGLVFESLLSNAVKFSEHPGVIRVRAFSRGDKVVVEVIDEGIGIPVELRDKIFERFFQIQPPVTRRHAGVGLGLSIVKDLVMAHGGRVEVESTVGKGSTFRIELQSAQ